MFTVLLERSVTLKWRYSFDAERNEQNEVCISQGIKLTLNTVYGHSNERNFQTPTVVADKKSHDISVAGSANANIF